MIAIQNKQSALKESVSKLHFIVSIVQTIQYGNRHYKNNVISKQGIGKKKMIINHHNNNDQIIEHMYPLNYMRNYIVYDKNYNIDTKLVKFQMVYRTVGRIFRIKVRRVIKFRVL